MTQPLQSVRQLAYVVPDLKAALAYWTDTLKVDPFFLFQHAPLENQRCRSGPSNADVTLALGNSGGLQIELIYRESDSPSVYKEFVDAGRVGVHHFRLMPDDFDATCAHYRGLGHEPVELGELWDNHNVYKDLFLLIEEAAQDWDGTDPVRPAPL